MCCVDQGPPRLVVTNKFEKLLFLTNSYWLSRPTFDTTHQKLHQTYTSHKVITPARSARRPTPPTATACDGSHK